MKLHALILAEEAIEVRTAADVWQETKDQAKTYISNKAYLVRKVPGKSSFEVLAVQPNKSRSHVATLSKAALDSAFAPLRAQQSPDAEGYSEYRGLEEVQAVKYDGDTIKIDLDGEGTASTKLVKGDYLIQKSDEQNFTYTVSKAKGFEAAYTEK